jgi:hypothetical protein
VRGTSCRGIICIGAPPSGMCALKSLSENDGAAPRPIYELLLNANNTARMGIGVDVQTTPDQTAVRHAAAAAAAATREI